MKYKKITQLAILLYCIALAPGCIFAYYDPKLQADYWKYFGVCVIVIVTAAIGLLAPFAKYSHSFPLQTERLLTRIAGLIMGILHFYFLRIICESSHTSNHYLAMDFFYFFVVYYLLIIFSPRTPIQKNLA